MIFGKFRKSKLTVPPEEYIAGLIDPEKHKVIAVTGAAGSGKTTLAANLKGLLPLETASLNVDDYFAFDLAARMRKKISGYDWKSRKRNLFVRHVEKLKQGKSIRKPVFSYKTQTLKKEKEKVFPKGHIIVEGTLDFSDVADFTIFCWASEKVLIDRVVERGGFRNVFKTRRSLRKHFETISIVNYRNLLLPYFKNADIVCPGEGKFSEASRIFPLQAIEILE